MESYQTKAIFRQNCQRIARATFPSSVLLAIFSVPATAFSLTPIGTYSTGIFDDGAAEISAFDPLSKRLFVPNGSTKQIDVLDLSNPKTPSLVFNIDLEGGINSVAYKNGIFAIAIEADNKQDPGTIAFLNANGTLLNSVTVGALPDMVTFAPDGKKVLVANEGEPSDDYAVDPEGSISIIDISGGIGSATVKTAGFTQFNNAALAPGVRIFGPGATVAQDLEPEYIAVSEDSTKAWVTLQENNALGIIDLNTGEVTDIVGLGFKNHSLTGNGLDASDKDSTINIATYLNLFGMYQPDALASYTTSGKTYLVSANEGDARDYDAFGEEERVEDLILDPTAFPNAEELQAEENLGRLQVTNTLGDPDEDGDFECLYAFGGRSFSIWDEEGNLVFDSGDDFEQILAKIFPKFFNADNTEKDFDGRSDNKGPEPEGITINEIAGRTYAFIGLERIGGIITYDITNPLKPLFKGYFNNRNFLGDPKAGGAGDLGPEGVLFISAKDSPNNLSLLVTTNEVSGSTTIYAIDTQETTSVPEPSSGLGLLVFGVLAWFGWKCKEQV